MDASIGTSSAPAEYNVQAEIRSICTETNLQVAKNQVINLEKLLI
jgi:hypothetical protein